MTTCMILARVIMKEEITVLKVGYSVKQERHKRFRRAEVAQTNPYICVNIPIFFISMQFSGTNWSNERPPLGPPL